MSALDRLSNYSAKAGLNNTTKSHPVFDLTTPLGAFLYQIHNLGYKIYEEDKDTGKITYTELYHTLTADGNQLVNAAAGSGKALKNGTGVLTADGYVPIETLGIGDKVYSDDGELHEVLGVFPQGKKKVYRVWFSDGNFIDCSSDHLWNVQTDSDRTCLSRVEKLYKDYNVADYYKTKSVKDIINTHPLRTKSGKRNCYIPMTAPIQFKSTETLEIPPYLLGLLLGNGYLDNGTVHISTADESVLAMIDTILAESYPNLVLKKSGKDRYDYRISSESQYNNQLTNDLRALGLYGTHSDTKFIPKKYLFASEADRFALLQGLIDTDGYYASSYYEYTTASEQLMQGITFLCETLGLTVKVTKRQGAYKKDGVKRICKNSYRMNIKQSYEYTELFRSDRLRWQFVQGQNYCRRQIIKIEELDEEAEMTCISVDSPNHLYITEHCIPTHNTTALTFKIIKDIVTGEAVRLQTVPSGMQVRVVDRMWVCTFLRSGASELQQTLTKWQTRLGYTQTANQINFSTLDAEFKRCLEAMGIKTNIGDAKKLQTLLNRAIDSCNVTKDGYALAKEDYNIISGIVTYARGRLDAKKYTNSNCKYYGITPTILDLIIRQYSTLKQTEGIMDFEDIQELLYKYLYITPNKDVQNFIANRYNYIYIDEFQDTSQMQYAILKFYARGKLWINRGGYTGEEYTGITDNNTGAWSWKNTEAQLYDGVESKGKIVAVGDVSQCIYSFKGSDNQIIATEFDKDFRPVISALSTNWRCPANILNPVIPSIHKNKDSKNQLIQAHNEGGEFDMYTFNTYKSMLNQLVQDVKRDMEDNMTVAILCRTNFDGVIPALTLESQGIFNFSVSGENMTLNSPLPRKLIGVTSLFTEGSSPIVAQSLKFFCSRGGEYEIKTLMDICKLNKLNIWTIPEVDLLHSAPNIAKFILNIKRICYPNGKRDRKLEVEALKAIYWYMMTDTFKQKSAYCDSARAYLDSLIYIIDSNDFNSVYEFIEATDEMTDSIRGRVKKSKTPIQITTVHEAKGKEWDSVYIWNDSNGVFPTYKIPTDLDFEHDKDIPTSVIEALEEERRVHYIACTRAKKREHIYSMAGNQSIFCLEMDAKAKSPVTSISTTLSKGV